MAHSTGHHHHLPASYLDGISVKISERYKPPKRITLALSYSQILTLNKLIQDPTPSYDFSLEESIKNRVHEWRKARTTIAEERKQRLHNINQELNKNVWSKTESNEPTEVTSKDQLATRSVADSNYTNSIPGIDPTYAYALKHNVNTGKDNHINGYYYNHSLFASKLMYGQDAATTAVVSSSQQQQLPNIAGLENSSVRSVPEIMKSLEAQLAVNHISEPSLPPPPPPPLQTSAVATPSTPKQEPSDELENPYKSLTSDLQDMVIKISYMGFPLSRVARACQALDGNQKKIVEHLLAMTDLLDLGFLESQVVEALLKCDNDRDKALDLLIT
ncbi:uncharacterized protein CBL_12576 [Carabus blaptoides fortunei]